MSITIGDAILYLSSNDDRLNRGLKDAKQKAENWVSNVGNIVQTGMGTALGFAGAQIFGTVARGFQTMAGEALNSVASYERLGLSLETLVSRELMRGQVVKETSTAIQHLTDAEKVKLDELIAKQKIADANVLQLQATFDAEWKKVTDSGGQWSATLTELEGRITLAKMKAGDYAKEIDALQGKEGQLATIVKEVTTGQLSQADAMAQAGPKAKELLKWITKLAVLSPFKQEEVADAFRMAMAYGFTSDEAKHLTESMINFASGSGASAEVMSRIALALGQIKAKGKLAGQEVLQLVNAGLPVTDILAKAFHKTTAEIEEMRSQGLIKADDAIKAIVDTLDHDFAGAAERQATSWAGIVSTLSDLKDIGLREFFTGTFKAIQPYADAFISAFTEGDALDRIRDIGDALGGAVADAMKWLNDNAVPTWKELEKWVKYFNWAVDDGQAPLEVLKKILWALVPDDIKTKLEELGTLLEPLQPIVDLLNAVATNDPEAFFTALDKLPQGISDFFTGLWAKVQPGADQFATDAKTWISTKATELQTELANKWGTAFTNWITPKIPDALTNYDSFMLATRQWIADKAVGLATGFLAWGTQTVKWINDSTPGALSDLGKFLGTLTAWIITDGVPDLILAGQDLSLALIDWVVTDAIPNIGPKLLEFSAAIYLFFENTLKPGLVEFGKQFVISLIEGITKGEPQMKERWEKIADNIQEAWSRYTTMFKSLGSAMLDHITAGITMKVAQVINTVTGMVRDALDAAGKTLGDYNPFGGGAEGATGSSSGSPRDSGGPGKAGQAYVINPKAAPELFVPKSDGFFFPNADKMLDRFSSGGQQITNNYYVNDNLDIESVARRVAELVGSA